MSAKSLAILAIPRTGTNYLCDLIDKFQDIESLYEIFHKDAVYLGNHEEFQSKVIQQIEEQHHLKISDFRDPSFVQFVSDRSQEFLDILAQSTECKYLSYKIFANHLSRQKLQDLIINNPAITKIIVKRNLLDVYLSARIAQKTNQWSDGDTSQFKLEFDDRDFLKWFTNQSKYYDFLENALVASGQPVNILQYETIHAHQTNQEKFQYLFDFLRAIGVELDANNLVDLSDKNLDRNVRKKQDKRKMTFDKISNPNILVDTLKSHQLEFLLA